MASANALRRVGRIGWDSMAETITYFKREFGHTLPESMLRFRKKVAQFKREGYACLISGRFQNQNSRKVNSIRSKAAGSFRWTACRSAPSIRRWPRCTISSSAAS